MSAQLEDGYTRIAHQILDEISKQKLNGTQFRILMVVWRFTYGFNRKDHEMSLSFFEKATELGKTQLDREIKHLIESKVLIVTKESTYTASRRLRFNKNISEWNMDSQQKRGQSAKTLTVSQNAEEQSANLRTPTVSQNPDQDIHSFKDNLKDITTTAGDEFKIVLNAFCDIHGKGEHQVFSQITDIQRMIDKGIPSSTIISVMKEKHAEKAKKNEPVNSFSYYHNAIIQAWEGGKKVEEYGGSIKGVRSGSNQAQSPRSEGESKIYKGKWDDTVVQMPKMSG